MKVLIVGGNFGETPKASKIISQLADGFCCAEVVNGGSIHQLQLMALLAVEHDLVIWMPNVDNNEEKIYPNKKKGGVLIVSKVLREDRNEGDAVARIFRMQANAVITIDKGHPAMFKFRLIDALGNLWAEHTEMFNMAWDCFKLTKWTLKSVRLGSYKSEESAPEFTAIPDMERFINVIKTVADKVENERGGRYFGNASTRCAKMFPSMKIDDAILVSARSVPKDRLQASDFVITKLVGGNVEYLGEKKPSVDTPIQLHLYNDFPQFNYMIHGHAYIENTSTLYEYYPCGDMREYTALQFHLGKRCHAMTKDIPVMYINLKNHGFIILASTLDALEDVVSKLKFKYRTLGEKI